MPCQYNRKHLVDGRAELMLADIVGTSLDGSHVAWHLAAVVRSNTDGKLDSITYFDVADWDAAVAQFREWAGAADREGDVPDLENAATHAIAAFIPLLQSLDLEGASAHLADGYQYVDHRFSGVAPDASGADEFLHNMAGYDSVHFREVDRRVLAIRGDRLSLSWQKLASPEGFEVAELRIAHVDADGRFVRTDVYDEADLVDAIEELNARYREAGEATDEELRRARLPSTR